MLNYRRLSLQAIPKKYHALIPPEAMRGGQVQVMDNLLDAHLQDVPGWFGDRHPNPAGYHVIGKQLARYLVPRIRAKAKSTKE